MSILEAIKRAFGGNDSLEQPPPSAKPAKPPTSSVFLRPPQKTDQPTDSWWMRPSEHQAGSPSVKLVGPEAVLGKQVCMQVHGHRLPLPKLLPGERKLLAMVARKQLDRDPLAALLAEHPDLPEGKALALEAVHLEAPPTNRKTWRSVLETQAVPAVVTFLLGGVMRRMTESLLGEEDEAGAEMLEHAQASAVAALSLARALRFHRPYVAYTVALLHDAGRALVLRACRDARVPGGMEREEVARLLQDSLHEEAGLLLAKAWGLPDAMAQVIGNHHGPLDKDDRLAPLRALVQIADEAAIRCGHGGGERPARPDTLLDAPSARFLGLTEENAPPVLDGLPTKMVEAML